MPDELGLSLDHYSFGRLGDGTFYGIAKRSGTALSNSGVVDLGDATLVFDTSLTLRSARELEGAAQHLTGRAPALAANSHWHLDHVLGNSVFPPDGIFATRRTAELLLEQEVELCRGLSAEQLRKDVDSLEADSRNSGSDEAKAVYAPVIRIHRALLEEAADLRIVVPGRRFDGELKLPGPRHIRLVTFGAGHTESDSVLVLPESRTVFAGDLIVHGTHPNLTSGDPEHWVTVLDQIERLGAEHIVPGHGPVGGPELIGPVRDYLITVLELAKVPGPVEMPSRFRPWSEPDQFERNLEHVRGRRRQG